MPTTRTSPQPNSWRANWTWMSWKHECMILSKSPQLHEGHAYTKATIERRPHVWEGRSCTKATLTWKLCLHKVYSHMKAHIFTKFMLTRRLQLHEDESMKSLHEWKAKNLQTHESPWLHEGHGNAKTTITQWLNTRKATQKSSVTNNVNKRRHPKHLSIGITFSLVQVPSGLDFK